MTPAEWTVAAALVAASVQLILASWRDLGAVTIGLIGASTVLAAGVDDPPARMRLAVGIVAATALASGAWARGSRHGVGRPSLVGAALLGAVAAGACSWAIPGVPAAALAVGSGALGAVLGLAALDRAAPRGARPRWYRVVPVEPG